MTLEMAIFDTIGSPEQRAYWQDEMDRVHRETGAKILHVVHPEHGALMGMHYSQHDKVQQLL